MDVRLETGCLVNKYKPKCLFNAALKKLKKINTSYKVRRGDGTPNNQKLKCVWFCQIFPMSK